MFEEEGGTSGPFTRGRMPWKCTKTTKELRYTYNSLIDGTILNWHIEKNNYIDLRLNVLDINKAFLIKYRWRHHLPHVPGREPQSFWRAIGGQERYASEDALDSPDCAGHPPRLFQCSNVTGIFTGQCERHPGPTRLLCGSALWVSSVSQLCAAPTCSIISG